MIKKFKLTTTFSFLGALLLSLILIFGISMAFFSRDENNINVINENKVENETNSKDDISKNTTVSIDYIDNESYGVNVHTSSEKGAWWKLEYRNRPNSGDPHDEDKTKGQWINGVKNDEIGGYDYDMIIDASLDGDAPGLDGWNKYYDTQFYFTDTSAYTMSNMHYVPLVMSDPDFSYQGTGEKGVSEVSSIRDVEFVSSEHLSKHSETFTIDTTQTYSNATTNDVVPQKIDLLDENGNVISTSITTINVAGESKITFDNLSHRKYKNVSLALNGFDTKGTSETFSFTNTALSSGGKLAIYITVPILLILLIGGGIFISWYFYFSEGDFNFSLPSLPSFSKREKRDKHEIDPSFRSGF